MRIADPPKYLESEKDLVRLRRLKQSSRLGVIAILGIAVNMGLARAQETTQSDREVMFQRYLEFPSLIEGGSIEPNWMADGVSFWYADVTSDHTVFYKVDPEANSIAPIFDTQRLREALTTILGRPPRGQGIPFSDITFVDGEAVKFTVEDRQFVLHLDTYAIGLPLPQTHDETTEFVSRPGEVGTPDGRLFALVKDHNLWLRSGSEDDGVQVTKDGEANYEWIVTPDVWAKGFWTGTGAKWSADGGTLALKKVDGRRVEKLPVVRFLKPDDALEWVRFPRAGDPTFQTELYVLDVDSRELVRLETGPEPDQRLELLGWRDQNAEVLFLRLNRGHTSLDLLAADPRTGSSRVILTETRDTYVVGAGHGFEQDRLTILPDGERFIWKSERDGWDHFYLYDFDGRPIRRLTHGKFPVLEVVALDGDWFYFTGRSEERPYDKYLYRVRLDGTGLTRLTEAPGSHEIEFSPSKEYFLDTHSSLERPPAVDLRRADGSLIRTLSEANIEALDELRWTPPEMFVAKALDGRTDLYGVLYKPYDFDASKKYPVIEYIYNGPQMSLMAFRAPFTSQRQLRAIAQLGFIVFIADGPGTPERGKAFHDAAYMRKGQFEIPEHINILEQLAERFPYVDLDHVGIIGHSAGGYLVLRAMLTEPEVYHVGIAMAPDVDLFHDNHFYFEPVMGLPQDNPEGYEKASNLLLAANLQGKLLMIVGSEDYGVYPGTMKMVAEFIRHGKQHDLIVLPGQGHDPTGESADYELKAASRYFVEHLEP